MDWGSTDMVSEAERWKDRALQAERERDEARQAFKNLLDEVWQLRADNVVLRDKVGRLELERDELRAAIEANAEGAVQNCGHREMPPGVWFFHFFAFSKRHWPTRDEAKAAYLRYAFPGLPPAGPAQPAPSNEGGD